MKVLIVDDQYEGKAKYLSRILASMSGVDFQHVSSAKEALRHMKENAYELLIIDLQIPSEPGQDVDMLGGKSLLEFIELRQDILKPSKILALTAHADSYNQCIEFFSRRGWTLLLDASEAQLSELLRAQLMQTSMDDTRYDIAIITALEHTELEAVLKLPYEWMPVRFKNDITSYHAGKVLLSDGTSKTVLACSAPRMGLSAAASLTTKVCLQFRPSFLAMPGIAAAVRGEAQIGDVLVADPSWDWGSGKLTIQDGRVVFLNDPMQIPLDPGLSAKLKTLSVSRMYLDEIYTAWKDGKRPSHDLSVHVAPVASGAVVLEDPATVELIRSQHRKTIGVEMEAYGVMSAAFYAGGHRPLVLVLKSVCDFADPTKNNEWQKYAAYTSVAYLDRVLRNHVFSQ